jgi:hypothetical protein
MERSFSSLAGDGFRPDDQGFWQVSATPRLQVIDVENGHLLASIDSEATEIQAAPDGETLFLSGWTDEGQWTEVLEAQSLKLAKRLEQWMIQAGPPG